MRAAEKGYDKGQFDVGLMYADGVGVAKDSAKAVMWLCKAADQGFAQAQYSLGAMYANGEGIKQDYLRAADWYRKAAEQGLREAQYSLGFMYQAGQGLAQDRDQAAHWLELAAAQGEVRALTLLNRMATAGEGRQHAPGDTASDAAPADRGKLVVVIGDDACRDADPGASAANLAKCYAWVEKAIKLLRFAKNGDTVSMLSGLSVGRGNVNQVRTVLTQQLSDYGVAISKRGYQRIAGTYRAEAAPSCKHIQSGFASPIAAGGLAELTIFQSGFNIEIPHQFEHRGRLSPISIHGVVVDSVIAFYDQDNSEFGFVGEIANGTITLRPDTDAVLKAWPRWANPPSAADLSACAISLQRNPASQR